MTEMTMRVNRVTHEEQDVQIKADFSPLEVRKAKMELKEKQQEHLWSECSIFPEIETMLRVHCKK